MKALAISGSPRKQGNTELLLNRCCETLSAQGVEAETVSLAGLSIKGCTGCGWCRENNVLDCVIKDDFQLLFQKMLEVDILVTGSPVYFGSATPEIMALLDRAGFVARSQNLFSRKVGGPVAVARRAGENFTYAQLLYWFTINDMIVPGSTYWNVGKAKAKGEILEDQEALSTIDRFAENLAWVAKQLKK